MAWLITTSIVVVFLIFVIFSTVYERVFNPKIQDWPPNVSRCPSYWTISSDLKTCTRGEVNQGTGEPVVNSYNGTNLNESKVFARDKKVYWDGVSKN